jgi:primosomal protein N' (replication factor Y)
MRYYEVLVGAMAYHGKEALTYEYAGVLVTGALVKVPLRGRPTLGIVLCAVDKPDFASKPISEVAPYPPLPAQSLELLRWLYVYYPAPLGAVVRLFVPPTEAFPKLASAPAHQRTSAPKLPPLTTGQAAALQAIQGSGTFLLHGITGSGKSRVYVELAAQALAQGKSALVLTPEIGLTAQLTKTFRDVFGKDAVHVLHSQLTAAQRRDIWYDILGRPSDPTAGLASTTPIIVIGPRSALFVPLRNLGLIVLDEAHDNAYKNESAPHYLAGRVAAKLAELHGATFVLGSATPSVEDYYLATVRKRPIVAMNELAKNTDERSTMNDIGKESSIAAPSSIVNPKSSISIEIVDMRKSELFSRSSLLSDALIARVASSLEHREQSLLYLNRRGTANVILCNVCGWQSLCPNCDLTLTYHGDAHELRCHVCGYHTGLPSSCPVCGNTEILFKSVGTKAIVDALTKLFPTAKIQRFDTDAKKTERLEQHVEALAEGSADIIVGTQMVGKGLDLPKLSVVGIINADSSLLIPDYTAAEQTYQLISQVIGRVGRGHLPGTVVVQTYDPENLTLQAALTKDWQKFYSTELDERKTFRFPPFTYLLKLRVLRATSPSAEKAAQALAATLQQDFPGATIEGPAPSFHPRERGKYSWQLLVKASHRKTLTAIIAGLPSGWSYDIDPVNLL